MNRRIRNLAIAAIAAALIDTTAFAAGSPAPATAKPAPAAAPAKLNSSDHTLLSDTLFQNQLDIDVSNYVAKQTGSDKVREFARTMAAEHGKIAIEIQKANDGLVVALAPAPQPGVNLEGKKGDDLDGAYVALMVSYETDSVFRFKSAATGPQYSPAIHTMAAKVLPVFQSNEAAASALKQSWVPKE